MTSVQQATLSGSSRLSFKVEKRKPFKTRTSQTTVTRENGNEETGTMKTGFILFTLLAKIDWFIVLQCSQRPQQETPKGHTNLFFCILIDFWKKRERLFLTNAAFFFYHSFFRLSYKAQIILLPDVEQMQVQRLLFLLLHFAGHIHIISSSYETRLGVEKHHHLTPGQESVGFSENILYALMRFEFCFCISMVAVSRHQK